MESVEIISTQNTKMMEIVFNSAIRDRKMAVVTGEAGSGKTTFAREYATANGAIYTEIVKGQRTRDVLKTICAALGIEPKRANYATFELICASLADQPRLIVIDQAEFLRTDTLEILRGIWDRTKTPIALIGIKDLLKLLYKHEHLYSRIKWAWEMQPLRDDDIAALLPKGASALVAATAKLAHRNFRATSYLIANALAIAGGEELREEILRDAKQLLLI